MWKQSIKGCELNIFIFFQSRESIIFISLNFVIEVIFLWSYFLKVSSFFVSIKFRLAGVNFTDEDEQRRTSAF